MTSIAAAASGITNRVPKRHQPLVLGLLLLAVVSSSCSKQDTAESLLSRADQHYASQKYAEAENEYREVLRLDTANTKAQRQLGIIYYDQGQLLQAYSLLQKSAELEPDNADVQLRLAQSLLAFREYRRAREAVLKVIEKRPGDEEALMLLANTAVEPNDIDDVEKIVLGLRGKDQDRAGYHLALGGLRIRQNNPQAAESEFKSAIALDPKSAWTHAGLATFFLSRNDRSAADQAFKAAADLAPLRSPIRLRYAQFKLANSDNAAAKKMLQDINSQAPDYLPASVLLMQMACADRRDQDCVARVQKVLAQDPNSHDALLQDGLINLDKGEAANAIREFEYLSRIYSKDAQARYWLANAYLLSAKTASPVGVQSAVQRAEDNLSEAIKINPTLDQAILLLAELKLRKGSPTAAIDLLLPLVRDRPQTAQAYYLIASAYLSQQQTRQAIAVYRRMEEAFPKDPQPPLLAGRILYAQKQPAEARKELEKSIEISADYFPAVEALIDIDVADKQYAAAMGRAQKLIDKAPKQAGVWAIRGKIYLAQDDFAHAEADLQKAIELDPNLEFAYMLLAQLYVASNRQDEAVAKLNSLVEKNKASDKIIPALLQLALLQQGLKHFDAARDAYEKLVARAPNLLIAQNNLALLYSEQFGELDKAYDLAKRANEAVPNEPHVADTLGWIQFKRGDYANALQLLRGSAGKDPQSPDIQYHLGMALYMLGEEAPARDALQKAVDASAEFVGKDEARRRLAILSIDGKTPDAAAESTLNEYLRERPKDPLALLRRAQLQQRQGATDQAIKTYEGILGSSAQFPPALRDLAILYARQSAPPQKAIEVARKAIEIYPDDPQLNDAVGWIEFKNGGYEKALPLLVSGAGKLPDQPEAQFHLGMAQYMLGNEGAARTALQQAVNAAPDFSGKAEARQRLELLSVDVATAEAAAARTKIESFLRQHPNDPVALFLLARLQERDGAVKEAIVAYEKILSSNENFAPALRQLVVLYGHHHTPEDLNKAFDLATRARQILPDDPEIRESLGILSFGRGYFPQAAEQLKAAASSRKDDPELLYYLGQTYRELNQPKECQRALEDALKLNPSPSLAEQVKRAQTECAQKSTAR